MFIVFVMLMSFLYSTTHCAELPQFTVIKDVLEESEMNQLNELTKDSQLKKLWYGRYNFWKEAFEGRLDNVGQNLVFTHFNEHKCNQVTNKLSNLLLTKAQEFGVDIANKRIILESYFDRNIVDSKNATSSGFFWHRDSIIVDRQKKVADFTLILLTNGKTHDWDGGDVVLQLGGDYSSEGSYVWVNSKHPKMTLSPCYNQAIIFKNSNTGHMVTPLTLLAKETVYRDVFIITCYFQ